MDIRSLTALPTIAPVPKSPVENDGQSSDGKKLSFGDYLKQALEEVNRLQVESEVMTQQFALGQTDNIHGVMIAAEKAEIALQLTLQIRNKILDAYSEIMRMQI